jgi:LytS/YehU family sensor histidine kinase
MSKDEAEYLQRCIAEEMPVVQVAIIPKKHHQAEVTYTLKLHHLQKRRILQMNEVESWPSIRGVWSL